MLKIHIKVMGATSFLALSYEKQQSNQYSESAWRAIHASWICDDKNNYEASVICRKRAISLIEKANSQAQTITDQEGEAEVITIDLMRRAGMFQEALKLAALTKVKETDVINVQVVKFEEILIAQKDVASHTLSEALGED